MAVSAANDCISPGKRMSQRRFSTCCLLLLAVLSVGCRPAFAREDVDDYILRDLFTVESSGGVTAATEASGGGSTGPTGPKIIFLTGLTGVGNFGGISQADTFCQTDATGFHGLPGGTYKAIIVGDTRTASVTANAGDGQVDWVLYPNLDYTRIDGTAIGTTGSNSLFTFPLTNAFDASSTDYWSGMNADWTTGSTPGNHLCDLGGGSWVDGAFGGRRGNSGNTTSAAIFANTSGACGSNFARWLCAEQ